MMYGEEIGKYEYAWEYFIKWSSLVKCRSAKLIIIVFSINLACVTLLSR